MVRKVSFIYAPSRSVSLLTSALFFQTVITGSWRSLMSRYFLYVMQRIEVYLVGLKYFGSSRSLG